MSCALLFGCPFSLLMALALICFPAAHAQTTGTIAGQVFDAANAPVPAADVEVTNLDTTLARRAVTNAEGTYVIPSLPPGTYKVSVQLRGFKSFSQTGITVALGQNARVDARLELGDVTESVTVAANTVAVDTRSSTVGATVATSPNPLHEFPALGTYSSTRSRDES